jgi:hypothetical protein
MLISSKATCTEASGLPVIRDAAAIDFHLADLLACPPRRGCDVSGQAAPQTPLEGVLGRAARVFL